MDDLEKLVANNMVEEEESLSSLKKPPDKRDRMTDTPRKINEEKEILEPSTSSMFTVVELEDYSLSGSSSLKEPSTKRSKITEIQEKKENIIPSTSAILNLVKEQDDSLRDSTLSKRTMDNHVRLTDTQQEKENLQPSTPTMLTVPSKSTRCASPDLFAESDDDELEVAAPATISELQNFSLNVYKDTSSKDINCYEIYSSDEGKEKANLEI